MARILSVPPNYGRTRVGKTASQFGRLVGGEPADRRGKGSTGVKVRRGRSK